MQCCARKSGICDTDVQRQIVSLLSEYVFSFSKILFFNSPQCRQVEGFLQAFEIVAEPQNKAFCIALMPLYAHINNKMYRSGLSSIVMLDETRISFPYGIVFNDLMPFFDTFKDLTSHATSGGLIQKWFANFFKTKILRKEGKIGPQVLTFEHLEIGFIACAIPLALSVVVFFAELACHRLKILFNCALNYLIAPFVFVSFYLSQKI